MLTVLFFFVQKDLQCPFSCARLIENLKFRGALKSKAITFSRHRFRYRITPLWARRTHRKSLFAVGVVFCVWWFCSV
jgi:hypothetical protein